MLCKVLLLHRWLLRLLTRSLQALWAVRTHELSLRQSLRQSSWCAVFRVRVKQPTRQSLQKCWKSRAEILCLPPVTYIVPPLSTSWRLSVKRQAFLFLKWEKQIPLRLQKRQSSVQRTTATMLLFSIPQADFILMRLLWMSLKTSKKKLNQTKFCLLSTRWQVRTQLMLRRALTNFLTLRVLFSQSLTVTLEAVRRFR